MIRRLILPLILGVFLCVPALAQPAPQTYPLTRSSTGITAKGGWFTLPGFTTTQLGTFGANGGIVYNSTAGMTYFYESGAWVARTAGAGVTAHGSLTQLDYASSGHTGFQPAGSYLTSESDPLSVHTAGGSMGNLTVNGLLEVVYTGPGDGNITVTSSSSGGSINITESGIDRLSAADKTFNIQNSGAGTMALQVDGSTVWNAGNDGTGSGLDADTVDGAHASSFLTSEVDGVIGNEVTDATDSTLTRSGSGTGPSPYTLGINLGNANTWTNNTAITGPDNAVPALAVTVGKVSQPALTLTPVPNMTDNLAKMGTIATADTTADVVIGATKADRTPLVVQGASGQSVPLQKWQDSTGAVKYRFWNSGTGEFSGGVNSNGFSVTDSAWGTVYSQFSTDGAHLSVGGVVDWHSAATLGGVTDLGLARSSAGVVKVTDGSTGYGSVMVAPLTAAVGGMTAGAVGQLRNITSQYSWTNAMVVALGDNLTGDVKVCTLPAKTVVKNAYLIINTAAAGTDTLTVSLGRTGATYLDYLGNGDAMAAANTVYGDAVGERGANLTGYDLPSATATTDVYCHFVATDATGDTLKDITGSTGTVYLETVTLP